MRRTPFGTFTSISVCPPSADVVTSALLAAADGIEGLGNCTWDGLGEEDVVCGYDNAPTLFHRICPLHDPPETAATLV
jgi:hypothetical protein